MIVTFLIFIRFVESFLGCSEGIESWFVSRVIPWGLEKLSLSLSLMHCVPQILELLTPPRFDTGFKVFCAFQCITDCFEFSLHFRLYNIQQIVILIVHCFLIQPLVI